MTQSSSHVNLFILVSELLYNSLIFFFFNKRYIKSNDEDDQMGIKVSGCPDASMQLYLNSFGFQYY